MNESAAATLWSNQSADAYVTNAEYRAAYGENRTTVHEIANGTAVTFTRPPATAQQWTRYAHGTYAPGDSDTSVHPPHADVAGSRFIEDAHATIFALSPATNTHVAPDDERLYVRPDGQLLGTIDYRIAVPETERSGTRTVRWDLVDHEITEIRLYADGELHTTTDGTHRPAIEYDLSSSVETVAIEADIEATLAKTETETETKTESDTTGRGGEQARSTIPTSTATSERQMTPTSTSTPATTSTATSTPTRTPATTTPASPSETTTTRIEDSVTVRDEMAVAVYDLEASAVHVNTSSGETGVLLFQSDPWQGYTLTDDGDQRVRGIWRFVTARESRWDVLVHARRDGTERRASDVLPVSVHAYPSRHGPRAEPTYGGPSIVRTWSQGVTHDAPTGSLPEHVSVAVVESAYEPTNGIAVETPRIDRDAVTLHGIVHGTEATITDLGDARHVRDSELSATIVDRNESSATVRLSLREAETGEPIVLEDDAAGAARAGRGDTGAIEIAGERVTTNETGTATVVLDQPGTYTARFEPASWLDTAPAYTSDTAVVRWHPLATLVGVLEFTLWSVRVAAPFGVAWYAGRRLGGVLEGRWS